MIPNEGKIPAAQPTNVDALLASGEDVMDNVVEISASLSTILSRMERGEGMLGQLTTESESGRRMRASILGTSESLQRIANKIEAGEGPLGRLLNDRAMADQLASSLDRFEALVAQAQTGPGLAPALLNDAEMKASFQDTLAQLNQVSKDLKGISADLETSQALLPKLINDDEYGQKVTQELRDILKRLNEASLKLTRGEGTAAKLLNDPQIYDAVNDVVIGVNESRILRWLIRNRQKKGIEKRYNETHKEMEQRGETPPPLDKGPDVVEPKEEEIPPEALTPVPSPAPPSTPPPGEGRPLTPVQDPPSSVETESKSPLSRVGRAWGTERGGRGVRARGVRVDPHPRHRRRRLHRLAPHPSPALPRRPGDGAGRLQRLLRSGAEADQRGSAAGALQRLPARRRGYPRRGARGPAVRGGRL